MQCARERSESVFCTDRQTCYRHLPPLARFPLLTKVCLLFGFGLCSAQDHYSSSLDPLDQGVMPFDVHGIVHGHLAELRTSTSKCICAQVA